MNTLITCLQLFGIGLSFGIIGPCFLTCAPVLITYITGAGNRWRESMADVVAFLSGRLIAYCILGALAGLSGALIRQASGVVISSAARFIGGGLSILLGIVILVGRSRAGLPAECSAVHRRVQGMTGLFAFGFVVGISPCAPLAALLFEIALIAKGAVSGFGYALFFGLGTFVAGLVVVGSIAGIIAWFPVKTIRSERTRAVFRIACASLLVLLGIAIMMQGMKY